MVSQGYDFDLENSAVDENYYYYFAYGSNMNLEQMAHRCPKSIKIGHGILKNYKVVEAKYADIDYTDWNNVDGLVWKVHRDDIQSLDEYEGYPVQYFRFITEIDINGKTIPCMIYKMVESYRNKKNSIKYAESYRLACRKGAVDNNIPSVF